jgi:transcriptional regulator with XRE-family HTH domain
MLKRIGKRSVPGLSERLLSLRATQGLSQQVLATRAGISIPRLRDAEKFGAATMETLTLLARTLRTDVDSLVGRRVSDEDGQ